MQGERSRGSLKRSRLQQVSALKVSIVLACEQFCMFPKLKRAVGTKAVAQVLRERSTFTYECERHQRIDWSTDFMASQVSVHQIEYSRVPM